MGVRKNHSSISWEKGNRGNWRCNNHTSLRKKKEQFRLGGDGGLFDENLEFNAKFANSVQCKKKRI